MTIDNAWAQRDPETVNASAGYVCNDKTAIIPLRFCQAEKAGNQKRIPADLG